MAGNSGGSPSFSSPYMFSTSPPSSSSHVDPQSQYASAFVQPQPRRIVGRGGARKLRAIPGAFSADTSFGSSTTDDAREMLGSSPSSGGEGAPDLDHALFPRSSSGSFHNGTLPGSRKRNWQPSNNYSSLAGVTTTAMGAEYEGASAGASAQDHQLHAQSLLRAQQERDELQQQQQQPPAKRRRGIAGTIVNGALNGLMYGGAAALTAYSLWSSWGARPSHESTPETDEGGQQRLDSPEKKMPEAQEEQPPPPPYAPSPSFSAASPTSTSFNRTPRRRNVYVSGNRNRRRRPAFQSARTNSNRSLAPEERGPNDGLDSADSVVAADPQTSQPPAGDTEGDSDEDDETYLRFQQQMATLIAQGQAALQSTATLGDEDGIDEERMAPASTSRSTSPTKRSYNHAPRTPTKSRIPQIRHESPAMPSAFKGVDDFTFDFSSGSQSQSQSPFRPSPRARPSQLPTLSGQAREDSAPASRIRPSPSRPFIFGAAQDAQAVEGGSGWDETPIRRGSAPGARSAFKTSTSMINSPYRRRG